MQTADGYAVLRRMSAYCVVSRKWGRIWLSVARGAAEPPPFWVTYVMGLIQQSFFIDTDDHPYMHVLLMIHVKNVLRDAMPDLRIEMETIVHFYSILTLSEFYLRQLEDFLACKFDALLQLPPRHAL